MDLARKLQGIEPRVCPSPWRDHEHYRGYGVMVRPFSSGHLLGLRVFPENDFAPYVSVWHRPPEGGWRIYNDGPALATSCPRIWGPALQHAALAEIHVEWTGPMTLRVRMREPELNWTIGLRAPPLLSVINAVNAAQPLWSWRPRILLRLREWLAKRLLGMGDVRFSFDTPTGRRATIMPEQSFIVAASEARLDGEALGRPVRLRDNPAIGDVPLPRLPTFVIMQAHARIAGRDEYERLRAHTRNETGEREAA